MTPFLRCLPRALSAEVLKYRRTLALALAFLAPVLVVLLNLLIVWQRVPATIPKDTNMWMLLAQNNMVFWNLLMLPLFVTLQTALIGGLEHGGKNWKHLFALPASRGAVYAAKEIMALALMALSSLVLWAGIVASGLLLRLIKPGFGLEAPIPWWHILQLVLLSYVASWLLIAIHLWIGLRWSSFVVAMGSGIAATIVAVIIVESDSPIFYPWTLPAILTMDFSRLGSYSQAWLAAGLALAALASVLGGLDFTRRDVL